MVTCVSRADRMRRIREGLTGREMEREGKHMSYYLKKRMREKAAQRRHDRVKVLEILAGNGQSMSAGPADSTEASTAMPQVVAAD